MRSLTFLFTVFCSASVLAEPRDYHVHTSAELADAIGKAESGATIVLAPGRYEGHLDLQKDVSLSAEGSWDGIEGHYVILDAMEQGPVLMVAPHVHVQLRSIRLVGGTGFGAGVLTGEDSTLDLRDIDIVHDDAGPYALLEIEGALSVHESAIKRNSAAAVLSLGKNASVFVESTAIAENGNSVLAALCESPKIRLTFSFIESTTRKPLAYVLPNCPTLKARLLATEAKLFRRSTAVRGPQKGLLDIDDGRLNTVKVPPRL